MSFALILEELVDDSEVLPSIVGVVGENAVDLMGHRAERGGGLLQGRGILGQGQVLE